ncbi:MAG: NmrA family NAD(P)-binding protein [Akkermansiaceae bacterium]|nr:NmrA family NAD(P)-binding protein [Akkermansiaceae bacterium]
MKGIVYTSLLKAHTSKVEPIAQEHRETEALIKQCGIPFTILRNGLYYEYHFEYSHLSNVQGCLSAGTFFGCAGHTGKFSSAPRADYAAAAVAVLTSPPGTYEGQTLELAGNPEVAYTLPEMGAVVAKLTGKSFKYTDIPYEENAKVLASKGVLPALTVTSLSLQPLAAHYVALCLVLWLA